MSDARPPDPARPATPMLTPPPWSRTSGWNRRVMEPESSRSRARPGSRACRRGPRQRSGCRHPGPRPRCSRGCRRRDTAAGGRRHSSQVRRMNGNLDVVRAAHSGAGVIAQLPRQSPRSARTGDAVQAVDPAVRTRLTRLSCRTLIVPGQEPPDTADRDGVRRTGDTPLHSARHFAINIAGCGPSGGLEASPPHGPVRRERSACRFITPLSARSS